MATCYTPFYRKELEYAHIPLPCGRCPNCVARRISAWSFRLMVEDRQSHSSLFVTLTYGDDSLPRTISNYKTLSRRDVQLFCKRLRKLQPHDKIKYYAVGEYGSKFWRPHYHAIIFNADPDKVERAWSLGGRGIGLVHIGNVTGASIGYCLKYMAKPSRIPLHAKDDRVPEFALMSKRLGANYLDQAQIAWHKNSLEKRMYCVAPGGVKLSMPRYYKDKIYDEEERMIIAEHSRIRSNEITAAYEQQLITDYGEAWQHIRNENKRAAFERLYKNYNQSRSQLNELQ